MYWTKVPLIVDTSTMCPCAWECMWIWTAIAEQIVANAGSEWLPNDIRHCREQMQIAD